MLGWKTAELPWQRKLYIPQFQCGGIENVDLSNFLPLPGEQTYQRPPGVLSATPQVLQK